MRKNGVRIISYRQYCATDLSIFAVILLVAEAAAYFAAKWFPAEALYTFSFMVPISLLVMIRWGWQSVFYALGSAILKCVFSGGTLTNYIVYGIGNCFIILMLLPVKLIGTDKITSRWWSSALITIGGWLCAYVGKSVVWAICYAVHPVAGSYAYSGFIGFAAYDLLSLAMAVIIVLVLRRFDGMFESQKTYLKRLDKERRNKMKHDCFGDEPVEIDEETLSILHRDDGLY